MIEKLQNSIGNVEPQMEFIGLIQEVKKKKLDIKVAEVGIGWGFRSFKEKLKMSL